MNQLAEKYWNDLAVDERVKLLQENSFWDGFSHYLYDYLPDTLKTVILLKIDPNALNEESHLPL
jgi:hypothetical protein